MTNQEENRLHDLAANILQDFHACTRHWSAWQYNTMSEDDFVLCVEDDAVLADTISMIKRIEDDAVKKYKEDLEYAESVAKEEHEKTLSDYFNNR